MIETDDLYITRRKPRKCPNCGAQRIANILYVFPPCSHDLQKDMDEGRVVVRACCVQGPVPAWECRSCGMRIYRESITNELRLF